MTVKSDNLCTMLDNVAPCYVFNKYMSVIIVGFINITTQRDLWGWLEIKRKVL